MPKQTIKIEVPLGYVVAKHLTGYHLVDDCPNNYVKISLEKAPYYDELQKLLGEGYENIGTDCIPEEGDRVVSAYGHIFIASGDSGSKACEWDAPSPLAILRKKKLTGADWLSTLSDGTVFYFDGTEYVVWRGRAINLSYVPLFFNDMADCSDETCEIIK